MFILKLGLIYIFANNYGALALGIQQTNNNNILQRNKNPEFQPNMGAISKLRALFFPEFYKKFDTQKITDVICASNIVLDVSTKKCSCERHTCRHKNPNQLRVIDTSCEDFCCRKNIIRGPENSYANQQQQQIQHQPLSHLQHELTMDVLQHNNKKPKCGVSEWVDFNNLRNQPFPWAVQIFSSRSQVCMGTLIHPNIVMSTAVCIFMQPQDELYVKVRTSTVEQKYKVKDVIIHEDFSKHFEMLNYNIALLILNKSVEHVTPICLPDPANLSNFNAPNLETCYTVSWEREKNPNVFNQQYETLNVLSNRQCTEIHSLRKQNTEKYFHSGNMCAETAKKPTKPITYSGSPLVCTKNNKQYTLNGLLAWSTKVNRSPYLFTNIAQFADWIDETVKAQSSDDKNYLIIH